MGQAAKRDIPGEHRALGFKSLPLKSGSTFCTPECELFIRMRFRYQNPSGTFERLLFKPYLLHISGLGPPDNILPLPSFSTAPWTARYSLKV